jgi:hypothetical protein
MAKERKKKKAPKNEQLESFSADPSAIVESADDSLLDFGIWLPSSR